MSVAPVVHEAVTPRAGRADAVRAPPAPRRPTTAGSQVGTFWVCPAAASGCLYARPQQAGAYRALPRLYHRHSHRHRHRRFAGLYTEAPFYSPYNGRAGDPRVPPPPHLARTTPTRAPHTTAPLPPLPSTRPPYERIPRPRPRPRPAPRAPHPSQHAPSKCPCRTTGWAAATFPLPAWTAPCGEHSPRPGRAGSCQPQSTGTARAQSRGPTRMRRASWRATR